MTFKKGLSSAKGTPSAEAGRRGSPKSGSAILVSLFNNGHSGSVSSAWARDFKVQLLCSFWWSAKCISKASTLILLTKYY